MRAGTVLILGISMLFLSVAGCVTSDGGTSGWVVVGENSQSPPQTRKEPERHPGKGKGLDVAARNHIRSAYRFLKMDQPDHALRELEKARRKMDRNFWYHYYLGGAFYMKGMHTQARDSWEMAYRYTSDPRLRSRIRTCQSFVVYRIQGHQPSMGFLRKAVDMDRDNGTARGLLDDLFRTRDQDQRVDERTGSTDDQPAFVKDMLKGSRYGSTDGDGRDDRYNGRDDSRGDRGDDDEYRDDRTSPRSDKYENSKKSDQKEKYPEKGKKGGKPQGKPYRIEDDSRFRAYFIVEMWD